MDGLLRLPPRVRPGDRVGVIAPSFATAVHFPERFEAGVDALGRELGVDVVVAPHVRELDGERSAPPAVVAASLMELVRDASVTAIIVSIGGHGAAELLPLLDPAELAANPTVLIGYSDATSLLLGIHALAGWCTFHGPTVMTDLGEAPVPDPFTMASLRQAIGAAEPMGVLPDPPSWTAEMLDWGTDAWRAGRSPQGPGTRTPWRSGTGRGRLYGGNLATLLHATGTPYLDPPDDLVLFVETTGDLTSHATVRQAFVHLQQAGLLARSRAVLLGRCPEIAPDALAAIRTSLLELLADDVPVVADLPFGHHSPIWTLPVGATATVEVEGPDAVVTVVEAGVR